jgi:hypothetical protein
MLFDYCRQPEARKEMQQCLEQLTHPSNTQLTIPLMDRIAVKTFKEATKSYDSVNRAKAIAALSFDKKLSQYQEHVKSNITLLYEGSRLISEPIPSVPDLLKILSALITLQYQQNATLITDRRESGAYYLERDVEVATALPPPGEGDFLFDKAFVAAAEDERKRAKALYEQSAGPSGEIATSSKTRFTQEFRAKGSFNKGGGKHPEALRRDRLPSNKQPTKRG